ncbi:MAG: cytidine deaminase, partial [Muribaculaceae bacterium]|nr:cytidine deaminase [Muribaculaceae bacterium]
MKEFTIEVPVTELSYDELTPGELMLVNTAREATARAYAPYSHFRVGAAILLSNGEIIPGSNQENAAFPSGTCAERSACFYAPESYTHI